jgi:hypothetical protein
MKRPAQKAFLLAVCIVVMLIVGCEEEENLSNPKKTRLIAAENMRLKKDLERRDKEIEKQKGLLEKCQQEKNTWKGKAQKNIKEQVDKVLMGVMGELAKLRDENKSLKEQIEKLKAE